MYENTRVHPLRGGGCNALQSHHNLHYSPHIALTEITVYNWGGGIMYACYKDGNYGGQTQYYHTTAFFFYFYDACTRK